MSDRDDKTNTAISPEGDNSNSHPNNHHLDGDDTFDYNADDILDDVDLDDDNFKSASQTPAPRTDADAPVLSQPRKQAEASSEFDLPEGMVMGPFGPIYLPLNEAISEHNADGIRIAAGRGEKISQDVDPIMLVAKGQCPEELDFQYHQSPKSVSAALGALKEIGIDLNETREGMPAAHRVTQYYGASMIYNFYDDSQAAEVGMTDQDHAARLAEFARAGVDFSVSNEKGHRPLAMLKEIANNVAEARSKDPKPLQDSLDSDFKMVADAGREFRIKGVAETEVSRREDKKSKRVEKTGSDIGD